MTRSEAGFRPLRVCMRFLEHQMGRPVWEVWPTATGAPSHSHGLSFIRKLQPMNNNSPRTFQTEAVVAASWPGGREGRRRGAAVQMTVTMVVDVPVLFYDKFPQS